MGMGGSVKRCFKIPVTIANAGHRKELSRKPGCGKIRKSRLPSYNITQETIHKMSVLSTGNSEKRSTPLVFYTYIYNHAHRLRLEKLL
jgi:hypothetical protein